ncbi:MAG TPA: hypothetical protein VK517_11190 [Cyclobacteriaceae bacterium]|nr:hypothetical protein [Cyclobacteriaceae bacterium]
MRISLLFLLVFLVVISDSIAQDKFPEGFALVKRDGDIAIYERWIIFPDSDPPQEAREVKGEFTAQSSIYKVLALIKDKTKIKIWQKHVSEFRVYPQPDTTFWLEYSYHDIPWPVSDQDHFLEYQLYERKPAEELFLMFKSRKDPVLAPKQNGVTRMILSGSWRLQQVSPNQVKVTYRILSMPIGIPRLFTDPVIRSNLMSTIQALKRLAEGK